MELEDVLATVLKDKGAQKKMNKGNLRAFNRMKVMLGGVGRCRTGWCG